jgi:FixJ family two-component response regulator
MSGQKVFELPKVPVICIIDDDPSVREAMEGLVRSLGYASAAFSSAEEYLQSDRFGDSSCLIIDQRMPGMSGAELQDLLIADGCETPIIFMTASRDEGVRRRVLDAGALGFFRKPIDDRLLIDCLTNALNGAPGSAARRNQPLTR